MVDTLTPAARSERMSRIRGADTKPELLLRKSLHAMGMRYRLHDTRLPGKPDLVFPRYKAVVLVHGCFWHRHHGCKVASNPKSNVEFWQRKFATNVARDAKNAQALADLGWTVIVVWECETNTPGKAQETAASVARRLRESGGALAGC